MIRTLFAASLLFSLSQTPAATAQDGDTGLEEIIVTGSRSFDYVPDVVPAVTLLKRADFMVQHVRIVSDTRDADKRTSEIYKTIADMMKRAKSSKTFSLGTGDEHFVPLSDDNYKLPLSPDRGKADTSFVFLMIKAPLSQGSSANDISASITKFIKDTKGDGRTEVTAEGELGLTIIKPERYRYELISAIAADLRRTSDAFGEGYHVRVENLEYPLLWERQGLDTMALYLPYKFEIVPPSGK